jgi:hypothetical protein
MMIGEAIFGSSRSMKRTSSRPKRLTEAGMMQTPPPEATSPSEVCNSFASVPIIGSMPASRPWCTAELA